tara:strand:- start:348 stop:590 length:243 start_codon:yes stop_codon:yes gene_type:complete
MPDGVLLGILTWLSMIFSFMHFPEKIKNFMLNHFVITDLISMAIAFLFLSGISQSITSVMGTITCGLLVNMSLIANKNLG